jgi:four helix bundle protein
MEQERGSVGGTGTYGAIKDAVCAVTAALEVGHLAFGLENIMKDFRDLRVLNEAHQLTLAIYRATSRFPRQELYGLTSQMRRCSVSIGANIAEGCGKRGNNEFQRFLVIASGSASELDYELLLANGLEYLDQQAYCSLHEDLSRLRRMLTSLLQKVDEERSVAKCQMPSAKC